MKPTLPERDAAGPSPDVQRQLELAESQLALYARDLKRTVDELHEASVWLRSITAAVGEGIVMTDQEGRLVFVNPEAERLLGWREEELAGRDLHTTIHLHEGTAVPAAQCPELLSRRDGEARRGEDVVFVRKDGSAFPVSYIVNPVHSGGEAIGVVTAFQDITERKAAEARQRELIEKLQQAHVQLLQSEKLATIGQLAAGVAHEINNPVGYISSNLNTLKGYLDELFQLLATYEAAEGALADPSALERIRGTKRRVDFDFLKEDVTNLLAESDEGVERVKKIVADLKDFSRVGEMTFAPADLHKGLDSTLNVVHNELKYKAEVVREYGDLPEVECVLPQLNQVFMNLLVNAAQAIETRGRITVRSGREGEWVWVEVADDGRGIEAENLKKLFDPFFTTKPVGKGTGLGLAVSYGIVQNHGGRIEVASSPGEGTSFKVWLPIVRAKPADVDA
ncbi:ATP-binding protein [Endothiovibrio diazotrophicus]